MASTQSAMVLVGRAASRSVRSAGATSASVASPAAITTRAALAQHRAAGLVKHFASSASARSEEFPASEASEAAAERVAILRLLSSAPLDEAGKPVPRAPPKAVPQTLLGPFSYTLVESNLPERYLDPEAPWDEQDVASQRPSTTGALYDRPSPQEQVERLISEASQPMIGAKNYFSFVNRAADRLAALLDLRKAQHPTGLESLRRASSAVCDELTATFGEEIAEAQRKAMEGSCGSEASEPGSVEHEVGKIFGTGAPLKPSEVPVEPVPQQWSQDKAGIVQAHVRRLLRDGMGLPFHALAPGQDDATGAAALDDPSAVNLQGLAAYADPAAGATRLSLQRYMSVGGASGWDLECPEPLPADSSFKTTAQWRQAVVGAVSDLLMSIGWTPLWSMDAQFQIAKAAALARRSKEELAKAGRLAGCSPRDRGLEQHLHLQLDASAREKEEEDSWETQLADGNALPEEVAGQQELADMVATASEPFPRAKLPTPLHESPEFADNPAMAARIRAVEENPSLSAAQRQEAVETFGIVEGIPQDQWGVRSMSPEQFEELRHKLGHVDPWEEHEEAKPWESPYIGHEDRQDADGRHMEGEYDEAAGEVQRAKPQADWAELRRGRGLEAAAVEGRDEEAEAVEYAEFFTYMRDITGAARVATQAEGLTDGRRSLVGGQYSSRRANARARSDRSAALQREWALQDLDAADADEQGRLAASGAEAEAEAVQRRRVRRAAAAEAARKRSAAPPSTRRANGAEVSPREALQRALARGQRRRAAARAMGNAIVNHLVTDRTGVEEDR